MTPLILSIISITAFGAGLSFGLSWNRPIKAENQRLNDIDWDNAA